MPILIKFLCYLAGVTSFLSVDASADTAMTDQLKPKILCFGGNGFIGSELVSRLIAEDKYEIFLVSRGNWYFDSQARIFPFVTHLICDREHSDLENCKKLIKVISENTFQVVYDFSAYKPEVLQESLELLNGKTELYVYISSAAIYEVCEYRGDVNQGRSREIDAVRPASEEEQERLNHQDEYGHGKFSCEEVPLTIPPTIRTSYAYVNDVSRALLHLIGTGIKDEVYNVGFENTLNLQELLQTLAKLIQAEVSFNSNPKDSFSLFPSATRGGIDISKLKQTGFKPTDFLDAMNETVEYYKTAFRTQPSELNAVVDQLTNYVIGWERRGEFLRYIDRITANAAEAKHNEL